MHKAECIKARIVPEMTRRLYLCCLQHFQPETSTSEKALAAPEFVLAGAVSLDNIQ